MRLWNSKAQKVQQGLAFLCLNLPPTTLLPSSDARCSMPGPQWAGKERTREEGPHALLRENRIGSHLGGHWHLFLGLPGQVGVGRHSTADEPTGRVPFNWSEVLRRGMQERGWQGKSLFGQWTQSQPYRWHFSGLSFLAWVHVLCAAALSPGGSTGGS